MYRIETEGLGRKVCKVFRSMIIDGDLRSGEKLVQDELADRLGGVADGPSVRALQA